MPASTADPIASSLKRTFSGVQSNGSNGGGGGGSSMGLMRGGNSSSINGNAPSSSLESRLQATSKKGLLISNVQFDAPTRYMGGGGLTSSDSSSKSRYIILNPQKQVRNSVAIIDEAKVGLVGQFLP